MRCVYCHDDWHRGVRCKCVALYHGDCAYELGICGTRGCEIRYEWPVMLPPPKREPIVVNHCLSRTPINQKGGLLTRINTAIQNPTLENINKII